MVPYFSIVAQKLGCYYNSNNEMLKCNGNIQKTNWNLRTLNLYEKLAVASKNSRKKNLL